MNVQMKKRLAVVSAVVVAALVAVLFIVGGNAAAKTVSVAEAAEAPAVGQKVQVSGNVVAGSTATTGDALTFSIYDAEQGADTQLPVRYAGAASSTFGADVVAICTGRMDENGVLQCTELVTKCPSKYEGAGDEHPADIPIEA